MMCDLDLFFKVTEADKGKKLSSWYLHIYNMYCFHIYTTDPYDETQVQGWVTLTYLSRSQRLINLCSYNLYPYCIHTIDRAYKTVGQI